MSQKLPESEILPQIRAHIQQNALTVQEVIPVTAISSSIQFEITVSGIWQDIMKCLKRFQCEPGVSIRALKAKFNQPGGVSSLTYRLTVYT